jgi:CRP/FNR family transcriptional regulator, dissimilatory nitrate respiration regulator
MSMIQRIGRLALFNGLPREDLEELALVAVDQKYGKGQTLFSEGSEASGFFGISDGRVKIYKLSLEGKEQILHIFGEGEFFGEVPVFAGGRFPAHAETLESSRLLFFPKNAFKELVARKPSLAMNMLAILSKRLRYFTHLVEDLSLKEVPGRLAAYLLYLSDHNQSSPVFDLDITKGQLASLLGTIPETLSRILGRMSQQDFIRVDGRRIEVLNREALESLAAGEKLVP